ncbi:hypothetical protein TrLO_g5132 [Triparma laevis f. longispina]|uniref:Uncharacterized protein n=1 Tax=Triparma laevis f. longispina TaxID=1714387 RepID=A0A9W7KTA5_9STRA|nr:hypothetical protein TrLO_g5132 [Triparma laevis f. longispina]
MPPSCTCSTTSTGLRVEHETQSSILTLTTINTDLSETVTCCSSQPGHPDLVIDVKVVSHPNIQSSNPASICVFTLSPAALSTWGFVDSKIVLIECLQLKQPATTLEISGCGTALSVMNVDGTCGVYCVSDTFGLSSWGVLGAPPVTPPPSPTLATFLTLSTSYLFLVTLISEVNCNILNVYDVKSRRKVSTLELTATEAGNPVAKNNDDYATSVASYVKSAEENMGVVATTTSDGGVDIHNIYLMPGAGDDMKVVLSTATRVHLGHKFLPHECPIPLCTSFGEGSLLVGTSTSLDCAVSVQTGGVKLLGELNGEDSLNSCFGGGVACWPNVYKVNAFLPTTAFGRYDVELKVGPKININIGGSNVRVNNDGDDDNNNDGGREKIDARGLKSLIVNEHDAPLPPTSCLNVVIDPPRPPLPGGKKTQGGKKSLGASTSRVNNPKSSGYGVMQPKLKLGTSPRLAASALKSSILKKKMQIRKLNDTRMNQSYPVDCGILNKHQGGHVYTVGGEGGGVSNTIQEISFNNLATYFAVKRVDSNVEIIKLPNVKANGLANKNNPVVIQPRFEGVDYGACWNYVNFNERNLICYRESVYDLNKSNSKESSLRPVCGLGEADCNLNFFYGSKFLVKSRGEEFGVMAWDGGVGGKVKKVLSLGCGCGILGIVNVNSASSHFAFLALKDRRILCIDVGTGKEYWSVPEGCGRRVCGSLCLPVVGNGEGAEFNLLGATSTDGGGLVRLWDIRSAQPAASFTGHVNRREQCRVSLSPCLRYLAVGGEGKDGGCLYDLRGGGGRGVVEWLNDGREVKDGSVVDVQWNPKFGQLATASREGVVRFLKEDGGCVD